uniref:Uncharacterized protein n=1 Tax=Anopheles coluzzii TaxID=1518534 RepID=A0A8W7PDT1_ANOCL
MLTLPPPPPPPSESHRFRDAGAYCWLLHLLSLLLLLLLLLRRHHWRRFRLRLPPTAASLRREEEDDGSGDGLAIADAPVASEVVVTVVAIGIFCAFCGASGMCVWGGDCSSGGASRWRCFSAAAAALAAALALLPSFELDFDEMSLAVVLEEGLVLPGAGDGDFTPPSSFFRPDSLIFAPGMADDGWTLPWWCPLSRLRLESLRSLRADEKPLLELVRFEICDFWAARSCFSLLLNSLNLSSMECFWAEGLLVAGIHTSSLEDLTYPSADSVSVAAGALCPVDIAA